MEKSCTMTLSEIRKLVEAATFECLCSLPQCEKCKADNIFDSVSRTLLPELVDKLERCKKALDFYTKHPVHWDKDDDGEPIEEGPSLVAIDCLKEVFGEGGAGESCN